MRCAKEEIKVVGAIAVCGIKGSPLQSYSVIDT